MKGLSKGTKIIYINSLTGENREGIVMSILSGQVVLASGEFVLNKNIKSIIQDKGK